MKIPRSSYYYYKNGRVAKKAVSEGLPAPGYSYQESDVRIADEQIQEWLMEFIPGDGYNYGYRKLTFLLKRVYRLKINKKIVYRLCKKLDILQPQRKIQTKNPRKLARNRTITASNQLFETDIKYGYIVGADRFFFIQSCIDVYDRYIVSYHIGLSCEAKDVVHTIQTALFKRLLFEESAKPVIRSDNAPQFVSHAFELACEIFGVEHECIPPRTPNMNAHIESFHRILQDDCLSRYDFNSYGEAYEAVTEFIHFYNERRIHSSIQDLTLLISTREI